MLPARDRIRSRTSAPNAAAGTVSAVPSARYHTGGPPSPVNARSRALPALAIPITTAFCSSASRASCAVTKPPTAVHASPIASDARRNSPEAFRRSSAAGSIASTPNAASSGMPTTVVLIVSTSHPTSTAVSRIPIGSARLAFSSLAPLSRAPSLANEAGEAWDAAALGHRAHLAHELLHLDELLQQLVHVLNGRAAPPRDAAAARAADDRRVDAFGSRHRRDDRLDLRQLAFGLRLRDLLRHLLHPRDQREQLRQRPELPHLLQLREEVVEREASLQELARLFLGLRSVDVLLRLLHEREHVAHPEDAPGEPVGMERLERVELLPGPQELDRHAGRGADREGRAPARVAVDLGEDESSERQSGAELARRANGVLPGHRVRDEQHLGRMGQRDHALELAHHLVVDVQPPGR